ncbi:MAG: hypothetical protein KY469_15045 [Actinobacteria bacterium]|nr:hypothetical protein [Actinomycetota bacterium]
MSRLLTLLVLVGAALATLAAPAAAACHIAAFVEDAVSVQESAGTVTLTVFLQGRQPSCEGTVDFATEDGSATAGEDYTAPEGTLQFVAGDDREETIEIAILGDDVDEGDEQFTVVLSNPSGGISGTSTPATVVITDAGGATGAATGDDATATPGIPTPVEEDTVGEPQSDATTPVDPEVAAEVEESGPGFVVLLVIVFVVVIAIAIIATRRRED